jgi:hypothetical protein
MFFPRISVHSQFLSCAQMQETPFFGSALTCNFERRPCQDLLLLLLLLLLPCCCSLCLCSRRSVLMTEPGHESLLAPFESNPSDRVEVHGGSASHPLPMLLQPRAPLGPRPIPPHVQVRRWGARRLTVGRWQTVRGQAVDLCCAPTTLTVMVMMVAMSMVSMAMVLVAECWLRMTPTSQTEAETQTNSKDHERDDHSSRFQPHWQSGGCQCPHQSHQPGFLHR